MKYYAGIGSRSTPYNIERIIENIIAPGLCKLGYILRSGGAIGADTAFERGCDKAKGSKEIWLPWRKFENNKSVLIVHKEEAFELARKYHPNWDYLSQGARKLHARNVHQILGEDLDTPCKFVVCYTEGGKGSGGTGQAIRIAKDYGIPIFDLGVYENKEDIIRDLNALLKGIN